MSDDEDFDFDSESESEFAEEEQTDAQKKLRYKLYAPDTMFNKNMDGYDNFHKDDFQGFYASVEFAKKAGAFKQWFQVVDKHTNKVVDEYKKQDYEWL